MAGKTRQAKKRRRNEPDNPDQSAKFMDAARKLGLDKKGGDDLDSLLDKLLKVKKPK